MTGATTKRDPTNPTGGRGDRTTNTIVDHVMVYAASRVWQEPGAGWLPAGDNGPVELSEIPEHLYAWWDPPHIRCPFCGRMGVLDIGVIWTWESGGSAGGGADYRCCGGGGNTAVEPRRLVSP